MNDKVSAAGTFATTRSRIGMVAAGVVVLVIGVAAVAAPFAFSARTLSGEIADQIQATTGLVFTADGNVRFDLLPRPRVVAHDIRVRDPSRTLSIDATKLEGDVRLLPLLVGRVELTAATLTRPRLGIDFDGAPIRADNTIGRAVHASIDANDASARPLGTVILVDGSAVLHSKRVPNIPNLTGLNVTIDWPGLASPATLTGSLAVGPTPADVAAWVAQPANLLRGDHSALTLSVHSAPLDLAVNGELADLDASNFRGHVTASAPSVPALLAIAGIRAPLPARFADLSLASDATLSRDRDGNRSGDLPNLHLTVDDNTYEGTLALQQGTRPLVTGTLASDQLNLAPFLRALPPLVDPTGHWSVASVGAPQDRSIDLDLRISANRLHASALSVDDAALSILTRDERTEVGLIEGKAYGGVVRARVSFGPSETGLSVRGAVSLEDVDAATLSWDAFGRQLAAGTLSASANVESNGATPAALVAGLGGWAKIEARSGELSTIDLGRVLHVERTPASIAAGPSHGRTLFDDLAVALRIGDGVASLEQGTLRGVDADVTASGNVDLSHRRVDVMAVASAPNLPTRTQTLDIRGSFERIVVSPHGTEAPRSP